MADGFWIWAVDLDYVEDAVSSSGNNGYLRVRLQQLQHDFYVARRWHADEVSLEDLCKAAQKHPHNGSFVSLDPERYLRRTWSGKFQLLFDPKTHGAEGQ